MDPAWFTPVSSMFRFVIAIAVASSVFASPLAPSKLRIQEFPPESTTLAVVDADVVRNEGLKFAWANSHTDNGQVQTSCRIVLGTSPQVDGDVVWDSGVLPQRVSVVRKTGLDLKPSTTYFWAVQWFDSNGVASAWSTPATFHTGPSSDVWTGTAWIGSNFGMLRREFTYKPSSGTVMASVAGLGYFQFFVNGIRVDTDVLSGAWTTWNARVLYYTYDITSYLTEGSNVIGVMLGHGWRDTSAFPPLWMSGPCDKNEMILRLAVVDSSSGSLIVGSDPLWNGTAKSPVVSDSVYNGEWYDARLEQPGWAKSGFVPSPDGGWTSVTVLDTSCFNPILTPISFPGIGVDFVNSPVNITRLSDSSQVVNFGDNLSGWTRIKVTGAAGSNITLKHAEVLQHPPYGPANGEIYQGNLRSALATDVYVLKGDPEGEWFEPHFTYHGFQYVEVLFYPGDIDPANVQQVHFHTLNPVRSSFSSSSIVLNKIQYAALRGQGSNQMVDGFVLQPFPAGQCLHFPPTYSVDFHEWTGDADLSSDSFAINYDIAAFLDSFLQIMVDNQDPAGSLPDTVPFARYGGRPADPSWSAAFPQNLFVRYAVDGDTAPASKFWPQLMAYFGDIANNIKNAGGLAKWPAPYGDWVPADPNNKVSNSLCGSYNYITNVLQAVQLATALNNSQDAASLAQLHDSLLTQYTEQFFQNSTGCYDICGQTSYGFQYQLGLVSSGDQAAFTSKLVSDITTRYSNHVSVGIIGAKALLPSLTSLNQQTVALNLAEQTSYPSWGYMLYNNLEPANSSVWELWDAPSQGPGMNSRNHHMFSSISGWLLRDVAGLGNVGSAAACGLQQLSLKPASFFGVSSVAASVDTPCGKVALSYQRHGTTQCAKAPEGRSASRPLAHVVKDVELTCGERGGVISSIDFASWGYPQGGCGSFVAHPTCHTPAAQRVVEGLCVGKASCLISTSADFWSTHASGACDGGRLGDDPRVLAVQATCSGPHAVSVQVTLPVSASAEVTLPLHGSVFRGLSSSTGSVGAITASTPDAVVMVLGSGYHELVLTGASA